MERSTRSFGYLRLSVTARCGLRCIYCRPESGDSVRGDRSLTPTEIETLVAHLAHRHGLSKVRITGGEPALRPDLIEIVRRIAGSPGIRDLGLTTSGLLLPELARGLADAGLDRVNISLDTLDPDRFVRLAGAPGLHRVLEGIDAAREAGLTPLRLNTVVLRGENDDELPDLLAFAAEKGAEIRFIELMPMGPLAWRWQGRFVPADTMRQRLSGTIRTWHPIARDSGSATRFLVTLTGGGVARVGFITPMSHPFCGGCDRIRISADGGFYPCLMDRPCGSILPALRPRFDPRALDAALAAGRDRKSGARPARGPNVMTHIGG